MSTAAAEKKTRPSSWTRLDGGRQDDNDEPDDREQTDPEPSSKKPSVLDTAREEVGEIAAKLDRSLKKASRALAAPDPSDIRKLYSGADLPDISAKDALQTLAYRLDREGDLWRGLALRALTRAVWADRFTQAAAVIAAVGCAGLAVVAGLGSLFSSEAPYGRILLLLAGAIVLVGGALLVAFSSASVRRAQRSIAQQAQRRADLAELRLHRVAIVLATRGTSEELFREALVRLEHDASAPPG